MTIFITGATGKTGGRLAQLLQAANYDILVASRSGQAPPFKAVKFDWLDEKTFENPFTADANIDKVYLVVPAVFDVLPIVKPFIDLAISKGVKRFVMCGAGSIDKDGPVWGQIHRYLIDLGVDYTVLRPVRFNENFAGIYAHTIRINDEIFSSAQDNKSAFIAVEDVAQAAYDALVAEKSPNTDYYMVGPDLCTHDEAAALLSEALGRKITYRRITEEEMRDLILSFGVESKYAAFLAHNDASGGEDYSRKGETIVGKHNLRDYFEANKGIWAKAEKP